MQTFTLKLKGNTATTNQSHITLYLDGLKRSIHTEKELLAALVKYEPNQIEVLIKNRLYPIWNIYPKINDYYLIEGYEIEEVD